MKNEKTEEFSVKRSIKVLWRTLVWAYRSNKSSFMLLYILITILALLPFGINFLNGKVIDELTILIDQTVSDRVLTVLWTFVALTVGLSILERLFWVLESIVEKVSFFAIDKFFTKKFLEKSSSFEVASFEDPKRYLQYEKARDIHDWKPREVAFRMAWMLNGFVRVIASIIIIATFSLPALLFVIVMIIPSIWVKIKLGKDSWGIWDASAKEKATYWNMKYYLTNEEPIKEVTIFRSTKYLLNIAFGIFDGFFDRQKKYAVKKAGWESLFGNLAQVGISGFWVFAILAVLEGNMSLGLLTFYIASMSSFSDALYSFVWYVTNQFEDSRFLNDFFVFYDLPRLISNGTEKAEFQNAPQIEFKNVSFKYPGTDKYILQDFSYTFETGKKFAIVGKNGAGKSTIIKLICRFYDPDEGEILLNGQNIKLFDLDSYYSHLGVLFQNFSKFDHLTPRDNVELGDIEADHTDEKYTKAIIQADAETFIDELPDKHAQILTKSLDGGVDLSGGQWQKLALARGFYRDSKILILDEPTSAIDAEAEAEIFQRLFEHVDGKTVIIISHRFSTVRRADEIIVLDEGKVAEVGSHDELIAIGGAYFRAFNVQAEGYR